MSKPSSSSSSASRRLLQELKQYSSSPLNPPIASLSPVSDDDLLHWQAELLGSPGSIYEGCRWKMDIRVPEDYPLVPPAVTFRTPCCHPNVHLKTGEICLDLLRESWTPQYTLRKTLEEVSYLLGDPEPNSPLNVDAAQVLRNGDSVGYESLVRVWGVMFAGKPPTLGR